MVGRPKLLGPGSSSARPRLAVVDTEDEGGAYFMPPSSLEFLPTGCTLLDLTLGGRGYPFGRIVNIVGDEATGKTMLAIEAMANFAHHHKHGRIRYAEAESAFDKAYAEDIGFPLDRVTSPPTLDTVEDFYVDVTEFLAKQREDEYGLYILDSLDALSDVAEMGRELAEGTYGASKAKQLSQLFRRIVREIERKKVILIIISQVRQNIGVTFGRKFTRSGGKALDFYASQILYLAHAGSEKRVVRGIERTTSIITRIKCDKCRTGPSHRTCDVPIRFGYGIDNLAANVQFLAKTKKLASVTEFAAQSTGKRGGKEVSDDDGEKGVRKALLLLRELDATYSDAQYKDLERRLDNVTRQIWAEIEETLRPVRRKYT